MSEFGWDAPMTSKEVEDRERAKKAPDPGKILDPVIQKTLDVLEEKGLRYDTGKNRLDLIPPEWIWALGEVLTAGANKYADRNWEQGMKWSKVDGPLKRHLLKWEAGEVYDVGETECHHLAMVAWNALALMSYQLRGVGENDVIGPGFDLTRVKRAKVKNEIHEGV